MELKNKIKNQKSKLRKTIEQLQIPEGSKNRTRFGRHDKKK
jgi:hypothetical protein